MKIWNFIKTSFIFWFIVMMILYAFFDEVNVKKTWIDYLVMPIPSFFFASFLTGITYLFVAPFRWLYNYLKRKNQLT